MYSTAVSTAGFNTLEFQQQTGERQQEKIIHKIINGVQKIENQYLPNVHVLAGLEGTILLQIF